MWRKKFCGNLVYSKRKTEGTAWKEEEKEREERRHHICLCLKCVWKMMVGRGRNREKMNNEVELKSS